MSADFFFNFLNELGKSDKMQALPSILSSFYHRLYKFNNTGARMQDPFIIAFLARKRQHFVQYT